MADKKPIDEHQLDALLQDFFLDENSQAPNEKEANFILGLDYAAQPDASKEQELISKLQKNAGKPGNTGLYVSIVVIGLVTAFAFYLFSERNHQASAKNTALSSTETPATTEHQPDGSVQPSNESPLNSDLLPSKTADTFDRPSVSVEPAKAEVPVVSPKETAVVKPQSQEKKIPVLAEKDRLKYKAIKRQMIAGIIRLNKNLYTKIPAFKTVYAGEPVVLDGFSIRNVGITNLEYKAFLADLLAQNRDEEYLICEVRTGNWKKQGYPNLANDYFQDKTYNDFPVVNISYDAAKIFCNWLSRETKAYIQQNNLKLKDLQIRLPYDEEWVFAAREGYAKIAFEKGYNTIYDEAVGLVNRSFTNRVELVKKHAESVDTLYSYYATNRYGWPEKEITDFFATGIGYCNAEPLDTIYPERMKVLGKFGHVSEIVPQKTSNKLWLSGLSWKNKEEYQKLEQEFKASASSPFVGFRIVVINPHDPEYKNPFW